MDKTYTRRERFHLHAGYWPNGKPRALCLRKRAAVTIDHNKVTCRNCLKKIQAWYCSEEYTKFRRRKIKWQSKK